MPSWGGAITARVLVVSTPRWPRDLLAYTCSAKGMARIHWQNLVNFGVLPLIFMDPADYDRLWQGNVIRVEGINAAINPVGRFP